MTTTAPEEQHHHEAHPSRVAFANEVADIVEQRIWGKLAKWLIFNIGGLIAAVSIGIGAYYSLDARVNHVAVVDAVAARQMDAMALEHNAIKSSLQIELRDINVRLDEINRYLRDHGNGARK